MFEDYSKITATLPAKVKAYEDVLPLLDEACRSQFMLHPTPTPKVCLFFHGFTAGPYQFVPMGEAFYRMGYNVLIPLMPGHGKAGDWSRENPPPLLTEAEDYLKFALKWLKIAQLMGKRVILGGLSGGGTLATWLTLEKPELVDRSLLFAPYLSSSSKVIDLFVQTLGSYFEWTNVNGPSYRGFEILALRAILNIGTYNLRKARKGKSSAPFFVISSESDKAVGNDDHYRMFESALEYQPQCWYHRFDRVLDIPHTMMTHEEGNDYEYLLITMAKAFVESDLTWQEIEEIAYRMTKGRTFNDVIAELGWQDKASPEMPAMMTMVDKWSIVVNRELTSKRRRERS